MTGLGTPIGAAPVPPIVTVGFAFVGVPSGRRISGVGIDSSSDLSSPSSSWTEKDFSSPLPPLPLKGSLVPGRSRGSSLPEEEVVSSVVEVVSSPASGSVGVVVVGGGVVVVGGVVGVVVVGGAGLLSSPSTGLLQPLSPRSTRPSPSSSRRFEQAGRT